MIRYILPALLIATPALAQTPPPSVMSVAQFDPALSAVNGEINFLVVQFTNLKGSPCRSVEQWSTPGACNVFLGQDNNAGTGLPENYGLNRNAAGNILIGPSARTPAPDSVGFVNIGNVFCGWRGDRANELRRVRCPEEK